MGRQEMKKKIGEARKK